MRTVAAACLGIAVGMWGCADLPGAEPAPGTRPSGENPDEPGGKPGRPGDPGEPGSAGPELPAPSSRAARLTAEQWENAVKDLLQLDERTGFSSELPQDALPASFLFDNPTDSLGVDPTQWAGFQRAASRVAELVTSDPARLERILPPDDGDDAARARALIEDLGGRAHRRPLSEEQIAAYTTVFEAGRAGFTGIDPFTGGVRLLLEALLQSPFFLYRVELSDQVVSGPDGDTIALDDFEIAARLSFALWGSIPDTQLFEAAVNGELDRNGVEAHTRRMLEDPRAVATLLHFHAQLLQAKKLAGVAPSPQLFPDAPADLGELARRENELFLEDAFTRGGNFAEILTSTKTFVNADLARIYGLQGDFPQDELVPVELDPALRKGIFTHVAFLAQNATSRDPDPIHRGVFLARNVACIPLSAPPANIPPLPPPEDFQTNREVVQGATEAGSPCADCHKEVINPFGFPYEMYDAVGRVRTHDNGLPVNTAASPILDDFTPVRDGVELAEKMAASKVVHDCYAQHWMEFTLGRNVVPEDKPLVERIGASSREGAAVKDLLVGLVTSPVFLQRSTTEIGGAP